MAIADVGIYSKTLREHGQNTWPRPTATTTTTTIQFLGVGFMS